MCVCQPLYNAGVAHARQGSLTQAMDFLLQAQKVKVDKLQARIDKALSNIDTDVNVSPWLRGRDVTRNSVN